MRRGLAIAPLVLAAVLAVAPAHATARAPATVKLAECSPEEHAATFYARMSQVPGAERMRLRFRLLEKGSSGYHVLKAPALERWRKSKPGVGAFGYSQAVRGLQPGAVYRARVDFRWYDAEGNVVARARRRSPACRQFAALPNLGVTLGGMKPGRQAGVVRYEVLVENSGVAPASGVPVRLSVDRLAVNTVTVASLAPGEIRTLTIHGPACRNSVEAVADPDGVLVESSETDNAHRVACDELA